MRTSTGRFREACGVGEEGVVLGDWLDWLAVGD